MLKYNATTKRKYHVKDNDAPMPIVHDFEIAELKSRLTETDYKIIKCVEYQLAGLEAPYDIAELHAERQALRDRINELEMMA